MPGFNRSNVTSATVNIATFRSTSHESQVTTEVVGVQTAMAVARIHTHDLSAASPTPTGMTDGMNVFVEGLHVHFDNAASLSTSPKLIARICYDANGEACFMPDTEADISLGLTTTTKGSAAFKIALPLKLASGSPELYVFFSLDAGTCDVQMSRISFVADIEQA